jgi:tetratricopeptide (TPR) repeat protein
MKLLNPTLCGTFLMMTSRRVFRVLVLAGLGLASVAAKPQTAPPDKKKPAEAKPAATKAKPTDAKPANDKMPMTGLTPAKLMPNLCLLKYRVSTTSPECQAFFDQGLAFLYSYVYMEAARSFETATRKDPECAMAWWGLSRGLEVWGRGNHPQALKKAQDLMARASDREQMLIKARLQEKGIIKVKDGRAAAARTLDELIVLYDDDEEAWFNRAQAAVGIARIPFYKALLRINPLHPGANHELVHFYEGNRRPALGMIHAENYIKSSPGIPHAFHMQAHLATRLGRWDKTSDRSARAIVLQRAYHKEMNVKPNEDWQFVHHLEILTISLNHDGRFAEGRALQKEVKTYGYTFRDHWFRLALGERNWTEALQIAAETRKSDKVLGSYMAALVYLNRGEPGRASPEVEVLRQAYQQNKSDRQLEMRLWETQGRLLCQIGGADQGVKLLAKTVERTKDDYHFHSWGNGAYYMEAWGIGALEGGKLDVAEEAFQEALAHDPGSVRAALGMQVLCERQGRAEEAERFAELAHRCWRKADPARVAAELEALRGRPWSTKDTKGHEEKGRSAGNLPEKNASKVDK